MNSTYTIYSLETGLFGAVLTLPDSDAQRDANTPPGCALEPGVFDCRTQRVDLLTGEVVPYRPAAPLDDDNNAWRWDEAQLCWVAEATPARAAREDRTRRIARAHEIESGQGRALRALLLNPDDAAARSKLEQIEAEIAALGIRD